MKCLRFFAFALLALMMPIACDQLEEAANDVDSRITALEERVTALEELCKEMNSNISSLQSIVTAMQTGDYITSVTPITADGKTVGYTITFAKGDPITIYHGHDGADGKDGVNGQDGKDGANGKDGADGKDGKDGKDGADGHTPVIGVKQDTDGIWYWTVDGEWLLDANNQKVKAVGLDGKDGQNGADGKDGQNGQDGKDGQNGQNGADGKDGVTPQLKIEDGYWYVSTDNGQTWTQLGKATGENGQDGQNGQDGTNGVDGKDGDSMFQSVNVTETEVTFVTADGQTFVVKRAAALSIEFDSADLVVMAPNATRSIHYTIVSGLDDITIEALSSADIKVKVNKTDAKTGTITVKTSATIDEYSKVVVLVSNGSQAIMRTLNFEEEAIEVEEDTTKEVTDEGGEVTLEFFSNLPCHAVIPADAQSWISVAPETKGMEKQTITLIIAPSDGYYRQTFVRVVGDTGLELTYKIVQNGEPVSVPDNEIWYKTTSGSSFNLDDNASYHAKPFNANVIDHYFEDGWWKIKCDGPITAINEYEFQGAKDIVEFYMPDTIEELRQGALCGLGVSRLYIPKNLNNVDAYALRIETGFGIESDRIQEFYGNHTSPDGKCVIVNNILCGFANHGIKEYSIPEGVVSIGGLAFNRCLELESIQFPSTLQSIGWEAFCECKNLKGEIYFPDAMTSIGYRAFAGVDKVIAFYGNSKVVSADHHCLMYDYSKNYALPDNMRGPWLAQYVGNETTYAIPEGVVGVDHYAFGGATKLVSLTIPESLQYFSGLAFTSTFPLAEDYHLKYLYGKGAANNHMGLIDNGKLVFVVPQCPKDYYVSDDVTAIGSECFGENKKVESVILSDNVTVVEGYAFAHNQYIKKVVLSSSLERIDGYNPFLHSANLEEIYFRSYLPPAYSDDQFYAEDCSHLTIYVPEETLDLYKKSGWYQYAPYMVGYKYDDIGEWNPEYYISSDYSSDGTVTPLQHSTTGAGIDLIFMGDAFSDRQIADDTYAAVMQKAADAFFSEEPYKSMKDCFNVYTVNVVSATEGYEHSGQALGTGRGDGTYCYGNDSKVIKYAKAAIGEERMDDAVVIVMMNEDAYAGTCFMYYPDSGNYGRGLSIAYFPTSSDTDTFNGLVSHEAGGHGFAKLADEYAYESMGAIPSSEIASAQQMATYGWWKNVDFTSNPAQVKWAQFIADDRYAGENIGCYEGAYTYWTGVWRPTENSIMRYNTGGFNAPSRYAIWYRIGKLAYGENWEGSYEDFVAYDQVNLAPAAVQRREAQIKKAKLSKPLPPLAPPVVVGHSWREELEKSR